MAETGARAAEVLSNRIAALHEGRPRVWSVVITVFGDAIVPRGGQVWLSTLSALFDRLGVNPGTLGAALSRLAAEDWLTRERVGRRSRYRLANAGRQAFDEASRRIYGAEDEDWTGTWSFWFVPEPSPKLAPELVEAGFGQLGPGLLLRPDADPPRPMPTSLAAATSLSRATPHGDLAQLARQGWPLDSAEARYAGFVADYRPLAHAVESSSFAPLDALVARTLLVHAFRRAVLKEPPLPAACFSRTSPRSEARSLFGALYRSLFEPSERGLEAINEPEGLGRGSDTLRRRLAQLEKNILRKRP
ncbi:MAG: PaaX family transcriptional regulator C-terminal domain-containing protein [Myxococcota bacterium]